jgi:hypothetical protein
MRQYLFETVEVIIGVPLLIIACIGSVAVALLGPGFDD